MASSSRPLNVILETKQEILRLREEPTSSLSSSYSTDELVEQYESLLAFSKSESCVDALMKLKQFVLHHGIPSDDQLLPPSRQRLRYSLGYGSDSLRVRIWKLLLGVPLCYDVDHYVRSYQEINQNAKFDNKIKDDAFRTFKVDGDFWSRTNEDTIIRILKVLSNDVGYVQGMNVLLGPFLYIMPELDAYYCCYTLCTEHMPAYIRKNLEGVHTAVNLAGRCLQLLDPPLYTHLIAKLTDLRIFAVRYLLTLLANVQPLTEVVKLWDGIFAFGVHHSIIVFCCYLINIREELLSELSSFKICNLIEKGNLDSELLLKMSMACMEFIPNEIYEELIDHIY